MSQRQMPGSVKGEALDELNRLRAEIVQNAHLNRFKNLDYPTANPDILKKCREGPGTDPNSVFYLSITKCRLSPMQALSEYPGTSMTPGGLGPLEPGEAEAHGRTVPWLMYERSPGAYPIIKDGSLCLSSEPTEDHRRIQAQLGGSGLQMGDGGKTPESKEDATHSWTDTFYADWEYRPRACSSLEAFRDWFRRWLDTTLQICCYADIYHQAFFDGTAHADGVRSMFIPDLDDGSTFLDTEDKESLLHQHETVEGYCHNWAIHTRREEAQEASRRKLQREGYLQGLRDAPQAPRSVLKENVYLRPVEVGDVPGLLEIFNHYAMASPLSAYFQDIEAGDIRQLIDDCNFERLPFIVAAERKIAQAQDNSPEKIYGYVLATDFVGRRTTARFTAELELFVKPGHTRKGIGKCLMDKLLEVCDPTYLPKRGYFFDTNQEDRPGYGPGGRRRLGRLLFAISYPADERTTYAWVEDWLKESYDFEEQGRLQGARVKFETFLNVTYLVRNIGYYSNNKFKP
ncbi:hypothetical protein BDV25DRAFT_171865 [Aspergillus avenaceus]|uniref:N-acetyltransferase domain-containing protein n=1 Tax=Aspergillus avenaceus TaxID=36643 RepID=A0A5N6TX59_ASPAV|nr:hypothetical protein BDV25DRAFT_171865 [Aspergillus avenaceus]